MPSLTSIIPAIAPTLGLSPSALYERQRQLVRLKLLPEPQGRGPGSGAEVTPENVALLVTAVLATDNLSDTDERVRRLANAPYRNRRRRACQITGKTTFVEALAETLAAEKVEPGTAAYVSRTDLSASIYYPTVGSDFGPLPAKDSGFRVESRMSLPPLALQSIRHHLHKALGHPPASHSKDHDK